MCEIPMPRIPKMGEITSAVGGLVGGVLNFALSAPGLVMGAVLGPVALLVGGALQTDQQIQQPIVDQAVQDNSAELAAIAEAEAANAAALAAAAEAEVAANAAAQEAAKAAALAQQEAQAPSLLDTGTPSTFAPSDFAPSAPMPSFMPSGGGGGGGGGFGPVPDVSAIESGTPPPFETGAQPTFDLQTQYRQSQALDQEFQEMSQPIQQPQEFFPEDETAQLTISDQGPDQSSEGFEGFGRVINYPEAPGIAFSRINPQSYEPILSYDERYAPQYHESGPLLPVANRLNSRRDLPSTRFMPTAGDIQKDFNNPMFQPQDIPESMPTMETNYPTQGHQTAVNIKRSVLSTAMPIRSDFGDDRNRPGPFDYMLNDLRSLQGELTNVIKRAEGLKAHSNRFSGMVNLGAVLAPINKDLDRVECGVKHVDKSRRQIRPVSQEDHEKSRLAKQMVKDMQDDIAIVHRFVE